MSVRNPVLILKRIRSLLKSSSISNEALSAFIISSGDAHQNEYIADCDNRISFVSGFTGSKSTSVITLDDAALWTDGRYFLQAEKELFPGWILMKDGLTETPSPGEWLNKVLPSGSKVGCDSFLASSSQWTTLSKILISHGNHLIPVASNPIDLVWEDRPPPPSNPIEPYPTSFAGKTWQEKVEEVRKEMVKKDANALVLTALDDVAWLLNLRGSDISYNPVFFAYIVVTMDVVNFFVDESKLDNHCRKHLNLDGSSKPKIELREYKLITEFLKWLVAQDSSSKVWLDNRASHALVSIIPESRRISSPNPVLLSKAVKNKVEIECMKRADNCIETEPNGPVYSRFVDKYRLKAEELKKNLYRTYKLDELFSLIYENIDYVGRSNSGAFISRLSQLTDPREKNHKRLTLKQIDFLTKLVVVNVNVLPEGNLLSLVAIILSQKLPDEHKLTITTLHEIRCRSKDFEIQSLVWLWKQSGFRIKSSEKSKEWRNLREEIISVVEKRVENFHYDFQNITEISQLSRILLTKPSSIPYLNGLLKNITVFTESIDYGLAWALLVQLSSPHRRFGRIESNDLEPIYNKCFQVIQDQFYENNFRIDNYVKDFFLGRIVESPELITLPYNQSFFQALKKIVKSNQKYLKPKELNKCLNFFDFNRYYPADLLESYCTWITDHPDDYLSDPELNPVSLVKLFSESRYFEGKQEKWNTFSKLLLDPAKIICLSQMDRFRLLSYLMIMNDYSHLKNFCPEFDGLLENVNLQRSLWRAYLHIYAGLCKEESRLGIEGHLIKKSLDKLTRRARKSSTFLNRPGNSDDDFDLLLKTVFGDRSLYSRRVWTSTCVLLDYVFLMDKHRTFYKFQSRGKNNAAVLDNLVQGLNNFHVFVLFPVDESHFCREPSIMRGKFEFKLSVIRHHGFIPIVIDQRSWKDLDEKQKITILKREIENTKSKCIELSK